MFFVLYRQKYLITKSLMGVGVKIPIHEAIIFNLVSADADRLLEKNPPCVLSVGE